MRHLSAVPGDVCAAILEGYAKGVEDGGEPFVLAEKRPLLRKAVTSEGRDPVVFWEKFAALPTIKTVPAKMRAMLKGRCRNAGWLSGWRTGGQVWEAWAGNGSPPLPTGAAA